MNTRALSPLVWLIGSLVCSCAIAADDFGQSIQIYTRLREFSGHPSWLLIIRDIDNGQNLPYLYDFTQGDNFWMAFTYGHNYKILASTLQFSPYREIDYSTRTIHNFCHLESKGNIIRGQSLNVQLSGNLTPNTRTFSCLVSHYTDSNFSIAPQE